MPYASEEGQGETLVEVPAIRNQMLQKAHGFPASCFFMSTA
jgi:hypothetical protein